MRPGLRPANKSAFVRCVATHRRNSYPRLVQVPSEEVPKLSEAEAQKLRLGNPSHARNEQRAFLETTTMTSQTQWTDHDTMGSEGTETDAAPEADSAIGPDTESAIPGDTSTAATVKSLGNLFAVSDADEDEMYEVGEDGNILV
eukprot:3979387-Pyramimonas_sp.AAC.1